MNSFKRLMKYIWPQWPSLVTIFVAVIFIGLLFSASFVTVIPLLKVMMGQEGIHGWVNRELTAKRYGMDFYVPERADLADPTKNVLYYLTINEIDDDEGEPAYEAGLALNDKIIYVGDAGQSVDELGKMTSSQMLKELTWRNKEENMTLTVLRTDSEGVDEQVTIDLEAVKKPFYFGYVKSIMSRISIDEDKNSKSEAVKMIFLLLVLATFIRCFARFWQDYLAQRVVNIALNNLRRDTFSHIVDMPMKYFSSEGPSDAVSRIIRDTEGAGHGIKVMLGKAIREPSKAVFTLMMAFFINWQIVAIFLCGAPFIGLTVGRLGKKIKKSTRRSLQSWSKMLCKLEETIAGLRAVKVYNQQDHEKKHFSSINDNLLKYQNKIAKVEAATGPLMESLGMIAGTVGLLFVLRFVFNGDLDESKFFTLLILLGSSAESIRKSSDVWNKVQQSNAASERVFSVLDQESEKEAENPVEIADVKDEIDFRDVVFTYPGASEPVLKGVNLKVKAGQNIAIVGPNGSGKTTLLNLLPRFYDFDSGKILIDGIDINDMSLVSLRSKLAVVSQRVITFNTTIADNISYGKQGASMDEIIAAAKHSYAHEFISKMPDGYNTIIGEDGAGLSGGQLQRIVIARAILKDPQILIFDEAMSQVDADSEAKISKALDDLTSDRTSFVIAHRFSTVVNSDVIAVVDEGKVIATGKHSELIENCPLYRRLYETQLMH
ncbi:MAG: ABC transporter ATP-binding protein [Sedimentisphaeraceae bacterium JB056]